ncbi:M56 family metallopeptidase [Teredinibacter turnerae]|uniref:M56 family metallopeptidase n=1 Tax=Teredinibacter turnerae TaxID=2426 RepID=UPI00036EAA83|nr:M56 family metallopeptidase [Teredinibacter turnerae]
MLSITDVGFWVLVTVIKPMLILVIVIALLARPSVRSAAQFHWWFLSALLVSVAFIPLGATYPALYLPILPHAVEGLLAINVRSLSATPVLLYSGLAIYCLGVTWRLSYVFLGVVEAYWIKDGATPLDGVNEGDLIQEKMRLDALFGFSGSRVDIRVTSVVSSPLVLGWLRPTILLPMSVGDWEPGRVCRVLAHEYAHIARNDWPVKILVAQITALLWFVPLVWIFAKRIGWYAEIACDDQVAELFDCRAEYAEDLLAISADVKHTSFALAYSDGSQLFERIKLVLEPCRNRSRTGLVWRFATALLVSSLVGPIAFASLSTAPVGTFKDPLAVYPSPVLVPMILVEDRSPLANNRRRVGWLNHQLALEQQTERRGSDALEPTTSQQLPVFSPPPARPITEELLVVSREQTPGRLRVSATELAPVTEVNAPGIAMSGYLPNIVVTPHYPRFALRHGISGRVVVEFDVSRAGEVVSPRVLHAEPAGVFDQAVLNAINQFQFLPLELNGEKVITKNVTETFVFNLEG